MKKTQKTIFLSLCAILGFMIGFLFSDKPSWAILFTLIMAVVVSYGISSLFKNI
jgi:hypothetical protein